MAHDHCCSGKVSVPSVCQTLDELEFERGIWSAALNNEVDKMKDHIAKGVNPNLTDSSGYSPLHYASRNGCLQVCKVLLDNGADVNMPTKSGSSTSLHRSAMRGHLNIVLLLLRRGADVNLRDADGKTALHKAVENCQPDVCKVLIEASPDSVAYTDNKNKKPIDYATDNLKKLSLFN